ncbi:MAG: dTDP-4-dehydrorhamnose 3,5-epimerase family protein [Clostridiales Family XIII bacterium]|jgi:dTDP-4-dehydrorhamnose 3,5-epimerase|nr:dTDP-4-dehydrorhamnose 3,5-epimerase family protein [Clostridiales Family XIII bacterium]
MNLIVKDTELAGVKLLITDRFEDYRGEFGGVYDESEYADAGLAAKFVHDMVSMSYKGVLRGMHGDAETTKLVQCVYGTVYSAVVNCDENSPEFGKWQGFILSDKNHHQLYIPPLYGNGYYVLSDSSVYTYKMSKAHSDRQFTYAWNDPRFGIRWPSDKPILSSRDRDAAERAARMQEARQGAQYE